MRRELTDAWLRALRPPETGRTEVWDGRVRGLVLRLTPGGTATWSVRLRTTSGKRTRPKLGTWPALGIADARKLALAAIGQIQGGADPVEEKRVAREERAARAAAPSVAERLGEWRAARAAAWSARYAAEVERLCNKEIVPKLGARPLAETTRADWTALLAAKHAKAPGVGAMLYRTAAAFLNFAEVRGWISVPLLPRKGASVIAPAVEARARVLSDAELLAIWNAGNGRSAKLRAFVHLLVMTACRESEAADLAAGELDLEAARWSIPGSRTKNGRGIVLPLHPLLVADLRAVMPDIDPLAPDYRLLGAIAGSGFRGFSKLKEAIDKSAGITGWRWHDLRRTARTGMTRLGVSSEHAEAALNHVSARSALERTYDRHDYQPEVIAALSRWQGHVAALLTTQPSAEVVPLRVRSR